jgi:hypothetical protein
MGHEAKMNRRTFLLGTVASSAAAALLPNVGMPASTYTHAPPWTVGSKFAELLRQVRPGALVITHNFPKGAWEIPDIGVPLFFTFEERQEVEVHDETWPELALRTRHVTHRCSSYVQRAYSSKSVVVYDLNGRRPTAANFYPRLIVEFEPGARWDRAGTIKVVKNADGHVRGFV